MTDAEKATIYMKALGNFRTVEDTLDIATQRAITDEERTKAVIAVGTVRKAISDLTDHD